MARLTIQQAFNLALQHHQAGRLGDAERIYRQILAQQPAHDGALHHLGFIAYQMGRNEIAVDLIGQAIALRPGLAEAHNNLGIALKAQGKLDEAIASYRQAAILRPGYAEAYNNLGDALQSQGKLDEGVTACRQAISLNPHLPEAHNNLGNCLRGQGQTDEAIGSYRQALGLRAGYAEAYSNLGNALRDGGRLEEAIGTCRQAIALRPGYAEAYSNLGNALMDQGRLDEAIASFRQAIALRPGYAEAQTNLGVALQEEGEFEEALAALRQAIALRPGYAEAHSNLGVAMQKEGELEEAVAALRQAIALRPSYADAHHNLAFALLQQGDYTEGWREYEWRWQVKDFPSLRRNFPQPQWDGSHLSNRTILLHTEQGFGDAIQFMRYVPLVVRRGGRVIVECPLELRRLLQDETRGWDVVARGEPLPAFDVHCPLLSLPLVFGTTVQSIPAEVPYLRHDPQLAAKWRERLAGLPESRKVGLAWAGNPTHRNDRNRSIPPGHLVPLGKVPGVSYVSLQKNATASAPENLKLLDLTAELTDFAETAALIANLDLVITVDTAVGHLAGAMGKVVWLLLPAASEWRWLRDRSDSPWCSTMRLFRQASRGEWPEVLERLSAERRGFAAN